MSNKRLLRLATRLVTAAIDSNELQREWARIDVDKPYKPRQLKQDTYHNKLREAQKYKPHDAAKEAKQKRTREAWVRKNKPDLEKRAEFVRKQKKQYDYD